MSFLTARPPSEPARRARLRFILFAVAASFVLSSPRLCADEVPTASTPPSPESRAAYWLDRIIGGPEPTAFGIPGIHKDTLLDAGRNLQAIPEAALARLADPELARRIQSQEDANPWHAILSVLVAIGGGRPEVARAWAVPALRHELLTLRRAAIEVFDAVHSPIDGPALLEAIERDATDRLIGPRAALILLRFGAPWDTAAARAIYARMPADGPLMSRGLWADLPMIAGEAPGGARPDLLAWWGFLTESAGPRRADPPRAGSGKGRAIDPEVLSVVALPHALTSGARAAAVARRELSRFGNAAILEQVKRDRESPDADVRDVGRLVVERATTYAEREELRAKAALAVTALPGVTPPTPDEVASIALALRSDESPDALRLLKELFRAIPLNVRWKAAHLAAIDGLVVRGAPIAPEMERLLALGTEPAIELALFLVRRSSDTTFIPVLVAWLGAEAAEPHLLRVRRELARLYAGTQPHGRLPDDVVRTFAKHVMTWIEDPRDPSAVGFVAVLADLGPVGEASIAEGLRSAKRALYVNGLAIAGDRYLGPDVTAALVGAIERRTPAGERRSVLWIVLRVASQDATAVLERLRDRFAEDGRADVDTILRIVRNRYPLGR